MRGAPMTADPVKVAERLVARKGRLAPRDGGRGREVRGRWWVLRWFDWRSGTAYRRGRRWWTHMRWTVFPKGTFLLGLYVYRDESDGEWCIDIGLWPLRWECGITDWPRPDTRATDADEAGQTGGTATDGDAS